MTPDSSRMLATRFAIGLLSAALLAGCGEQLFSTGPPDTTPTSKTPGAATSPSPPAKPDGTTRVTFVGWLKGEPLVAAWRSRAASDGWALWTRRATGWMATGQLPAGGPPITDGRSTANVLDPEARAGDLGIVTDDRLQIVTLPDAAWARAWRAILDLVPAGDGGGYLLVGAPALAIVSEDGGITVSPLPDGYVALAPTSNPNQFLLATSDDAAEAGGLSASTPFAAYIWKRGSSEPRLVQDRAVQIRASTQGLAWLQDAAGAWFDLTLTGEPKRFAGADRSAIEISPDGSVIVSATDARSGCDVMATDPCTIVIEGRAGARTTLVGPADGIAIENGAVGMMLRPRPSLGLPSRLVSGDPLDPTITPLD